MTSAGLSPPAVDLWDAAAGSRPAICSPILSTKELMLPRMPSPVPVGSNQ